MAKFAFRLPDIGEGVAEAEIVEWHVKAGDTIDEDDPLCDVMTDKATVDMTSPVAGKVLTINGEVGDLLAVGSVLVELEVEGEVDEDLVEDAPPAQDAQAGDPAPEPSPEPPSETDAAPEPGKAPRTDPTPGEPPKVRTKRPTASPTGPQVDADFALAAPATRRLAAKRGVDLSRVAGSGRNGRVTPEDIDAYLDSSGGPRNVARDGTEEVKIVGLRRKIADRMAEAKRHIPHITYVEEFDLTELETLREKLNEAHPDRPKLTILPFFVRALAKLLPDFPDANAHYDDDANVLTRHAGVHIGIAAATDGGLMVPVLRNAEAMDLWEAAAEIGRLAKAARDGSAKREELSGSTITITSLGPLGGIATTPIINRPEVAIIGPNKLTEKLVRDGPLLTSRKVMNVSSGFDHRIIDGYEAARLIQALKRVLETPALLFMD